MFTLIGNEFMIARAQETLVESFLLEPCLGIPNHERFPLLIYRSAFVSEQRLSADILVEQFAANHWTNAWENGVFDYHHFHANTHEVLGVLGGEAVVLFGGQSGVETTVARGDVLIIPAGVGHKAVSGSNRFSVVGAYPEGAIPDLCRDTGSIEVSVKSRIDALPIPTHDPVFGSNSLIHKFWADDGSSFRRS